MDELLNQYESALLSFERLTWNARDIFGGILLSISVLWLARIFLRATIVSIYGARAGSFFAGITEIVLSCVLAFKAMDNPGVIMTSIGWSAAVFRHLWYCILKI